MKYLLCLETFPAQIVSISLQTFEKEIIHEITNGIPDGIWFDYATRRIYWTSMGELGIPQELLVDSNGKLNWDKIREADIAGLFTKDGSVESCKVDGSDHRILINNGLITTPKQITGDSDKGRIFWCDREGMAIMSSNIDGSNFQTLLQYEQDNVDPVEKYCVGISLDPKKDFLYWTQKGPSKGGKGKILRKKLDEAQIQSSIELLIDSLPEPIDLDFGIKTGKLYWTDRGSEPDGNSLNCAIITSEGMIVNRQIIAKGFYEAIGLAVDEEEDVAYVSDLSGKIYKINLKNGSSDIIFNQGPTTGITLLNNL